VSSRRKRGGRSRRRTLAATFVRWAKDHDCSLRARSALKKPTERSHGQGPFLVVANSRIKKRPSAVWKRE
jgi:hypothetical protein